MRYRFFNGGDAGTCKMHPECYEAMEQAAHEEGGWFEWIPGMERPTPNAELTRAARDDEMVRFTEVNYVVCS